MRSTAVGLHVRKHQAGGPAAGAQGSGKLRCKRPRGRCCLARTQASRVGRFGAGSTGQALPVATLQRRSRGSPPCPERLSGRDSAGSVRDFRTPLPRQHRSPRHESHSPADPRPARPPPQEIPQSRTSGQRRKESLAGSAAMVGRAHTQDWSAPAIIPMPLRERTRSRGGTSRHVPEDTLPAQRTRAV